MILAGVWQYGSLPTDPWKLSKLLNIRYEVTTRWLQEWSKLVVCVEHGCSEHVVAVESPCSQCVVPKLQNFAETLRKNGASPEQRRGEETKEERDDADVDGQAAALPSSPPSSTGQTGEKQPVSTPSSAPPPTVEAGDSKRPFAAPAKVGKAPGPQLNDIREWPDSESRFGISGQRIRNCIIYQLDVLKSPWYSDKAFPTINKLDSEGYVNKLNADTPVGWTPASAKKVPHGWSGQIYKVDEPNFD
jgi:hypothetical protein